MSDAYPQRIVCLTEESTEVLYALGEAHRIVGISGATGGLTRACKEKLRVSASTSASIDKILNLEPDLAIGFAAMQADIAQALIKGGVEVWISNHRSVVGILGYVRRLGALVGAYGNAESYARELEAQLARVRRAAACLPRRPRIYFEECDKPRTSAVRWVSELIDIAGGTDVLSERAASCLGHVADPQALVRAAPDIIIGSRFGKKFQPQQMAARPGWGVIPAVRDGEFHEIKSSLLLRPGPAALTDGIGALHAIIARWSTKFGASSVNTSFGNKPCSRNGTEP